MQSDQRKKRRRFSQQFKKDACRLVIDGGQTITETAENLGIGIGLL
ncbi:MAG: transposase, partial [Oligoflexales bacterium]